MKRTIVFLMAAMLNLGVVPPLAFAQDKEPAEKKHKPTRAERREARREAREERAEKKRQAREERRNRNKGADSGDK